MKLHELRAAANAIAMKMRALHTDIGDSAWTDEQRHQWNQMKADLDATEERIAREEQLRANDQRFVETTTEEQRGRQAPAGQQQSGDRASEYRAAFDTFLRRGASELTSEQRQLIREMRAMSTGNDAAGGYTVPTEFRQRIVEAMKAFGGLAAVCQILDTDAGNPIDWVTSDGTTEEGELLAENAESTEGEPTFGVAQLGAKKLGSKIIRVSNELLADNFVDIETFLVNRIAMRLFRGEAKLLVNGTGTGTPVQPKGLKASVILSQAAAANTGITYTDIINLKHKVDPAYRAASMAKFGFNDTTLKAMKLMVDSQGRPLWLPAIAGVAPSVIDGDEYFIDQAIDGFGAGKVPMYYGDFKAFILRRVKAMAIKRLVERYAEFDQTGFLAFHRFDCVLEDTSAISKLTMA